MRILAKTALIGTIACAGSVLGMIAWVDGALSAASQNPRLCMAQKDRQAISNGTFRLDRRDALVSRWVNYAQGVPRGAAWWHLRGAAIHLTYRVFWSPSERAGVFGRLASEMRDCR